MLQKLGVRPGKNLIVFTDNTTTEGVIRNRRSNDFHVNAEWKKIQALIDLTPKRVSSEENRADGLSRGDKTETIDYPWVNLRGTTKSKMNLQKLKEFTANGSKPISPSEVESHFLRGWSYNTLISYNAAIKKFNKCMASRGISNFQLPLSADDVEYFCFWAGRVKNAPSNQDVTAKTLEKYLSGLKAWHLFHKKPYPREADERVAIFLRSSGKADAVAAQKPKKSAVRLHHLVFLAESLISKSPTERAVLDLALVAFWGMARLAEVTYGNETGKVNNSLKVLTTDVEEVSDTLTQITLRSAKTCKAGKTQIIKLRALPNALCPVKAIRRRLAEAGPNTTSLFGYFVNGERHHVTRTIAVSILNNAWSAGGFQELSGHSFRVGGASIRMALGVSITDICTLGRWKSECYKLYIRLYTPDERKATLKLLDQLQKSWEQTEER
ncbi:hypothetical protein PSTG_02852 [Puccinia striiformis f. sp. tritici PST-78]|uniref:Tyr recombinase domain-containing protein n=2 Tax=Puccinia striiformis f. sp. tritici TaxID=168172 RepID=A0A0L0VWW3_9BASI|nr:hypothetical protein PSTG_02852 [Puccinia striiformis f. sp. tritici PST-78]